MEDHLAEKRQLVKVFQSSSRKTVMMMCGLLLWCWSFHSGCGGKNIGCCSRWGGANAKTSPSTSGVPGPDIHIFLFVRAVRVRRSPPPTPTTVLVFL